MATYIVPVTIADERRVTVEAASAAEAKEKVKAGKHKRLGRSLTRGFLLVGEPERDDA